MAILWWLYSSNCEPQNSWVTEFSVSSELLCDGHPEAIDRLRIAQTKMKSYTSSTSYYEASNCLRIFFLQFAKNMQISNIQISWALNSKIADPSA